MYEKVIKRVLDIILAITILVFLSWLYLIVAIAVAIDRPGTVIFSQKRVGKGKKIFYVHKFRSMIKEAPHDMPTHLLENPEKYITKVGGFLRRNSLDELPQVWEILIGHMSFVGPRPALWNQTDLIEERDKYHANDVRPGLTGWAQINGRDELGIELKAKYDGEYVAVLKKGGWQALRMDVKCFMVTLAFVLTRNGFAEGKSGAGKKNGSDSGKI